MRCYTYFFLVILDYDKTNWINMATESNADKAATEQLAARPAQIPTHPDETENLPPENIVPDGVSPPIRHPLDPLNAGKNMNTIQLFFNFL